MFKYKTEAELTAMTPEQRDAYGVEKRTFESTQTKAQIEAAIDAFKAANPAPAMPEMPITKAEVDELKETINQLKEANAGSTAKVIPLDKAIETEMVKIKDAGSNRKTHEFVVKADTLRASVVGNPSALDLPDIGQLAHRKLTVYDMFTKVPVPKDANGVVRYTDWDADTIVRAAAAVAEGATFAESTAKWATYTLELKKVGDSVPVSEELLYDAPRFAAELKSFLETNVDIVIDTALVDGAGTTVYVKGLKTQIPNYSATAAGIVDCNIYDLLVKVRESITASYGSKYSPNVALMNITDINRMKLKKDANNNYIMPPFVDKNGNIVDGMLVLECNAFSANTMAIGDSRYGKIYEEPGTYVATGYDGSDWSNDMQTMKARKRLNLLIRTVDQTGWKEVTDIDAAIATLGTL